MHIDPEVLKKLGEIQTVLNESNLSKYMVALIGLAGVIAGSAVTAYVQLKVAKNNTNNEYKKQKRQLVADLIAKNRQLWLTSLRETAVDFIISCDVQYNARTTVDIIESKDAVISGLKSLSRAHLIELQLDPSVPTQLNVINAVRKLHAVVIGDLALEDYKEKYRETMIIFKSTMLSLSKKVDDEIIEMLNS